jgi:type VII secretion protein EccB
LAIRKDQLDALGFARRRMVANLLAPSSTGSDEAAPRPVRAFVTSAVLSALAVAGVAVLGVFKPSAPDGWQSGLAVDSASGAAYVYSAQDHELHPALNITSARLILGARFQKFDVPDSTINSVTMGAPYGIEGAPPDVPAAGSVDLNSWTLCVQQDTNSAGRSVPSGKTTLEVGYGRGDLNVLAPTDADDVINQHSALIVHDSQRRNYLIDGDYAYPIDDIQTVFAISGASAPTGGTVGPWVSTAWLGGFASGDPIDFPSVEGLGGPLPPGLTGQPGTVLGQFGRGPDGRDGYIETATGLVEVNPFVYALYSGSPAVSAAKVPGFVPALTPAAINEARVTNESSAGSASSLDAVGGNWPQIVPTLSDFDGSDPAYQTLCTNYDGSFDQNVAHLDVWHGRQLPNPLGADQGISQSGGDQLADVVDVRAGHGAYSRAVSGGDSRNTGPLYLTVDTGSRYQLATNVLIPGADGGQPAQTSAAQMLQYSSLTPEPVPDSWMRLIQPGATLDPSIAGTTPTSTGLTGQ